MGRRITTKEAALGQEQEFKMKKTDRRRGRVAHGMTTALLLLVLAVPAHSAIELQGLHAYADRESVPVGEMIRFHVSSQVPYRFGVSKLGLRVDDRVSDETILSAKKMSPAHV